MTIVQIQQGEEIKTYAVEVVDGEEQFTLADGYEGAEVIDISPAAREKLEALLEQIRKDTHDRH